LTFSTLPEARLLGLLKGSEDKKQGSKGVVNKMISIFFSTGDILDLFSIKVRIKCNKEEFKISKFDFKQNKFDLKEHEFDFKLNQSDFKLNQSDFKLNKSDFKLNKI
jgi:hypothetical protein